jgi:hypothetical protein
MQCAARLATGLQKAGPEVSIPLINGSGVYWQQSEAKNRLSKQSIPKIYDARALMLPTHRMG